MPPVLDDIIKLKRKKIKEEKREQKVPVGANGGGGNENGTFAICILFYNILIMILLTINPFDILFFIFLIHFVIGLSLLSLFCHLLSMSKHGS